MTGQRCALASSSSAVTNTGTAPSVGWSPTMRVNGSYHCASGSSALTEMRSRTFRAAPNGFLVDRGDAGDKRLRQRSIAAHANPTGRSAGSRWQEAPRAARANSSWVSTAFGSPPAVAESTHRNDGVAETERSSRDTSRTHSWTSTRNSGRRCSARTRRARESRQMNLPSACSTSAGRAQGRSGPRRVLGC